MSCNNNQITKFLYKTIIFDEISFTEIFEFLSMCFSIFHSCISNIYLYPFPKTFTLATSCKYKLPLHSLHKRGEFCSLHHHHINGNSIRRITSLSFRSDEQNH